jgi:uncharacterized repeat protein (TIGR02543 family)
LIKNKFGILLIAILLLFSIFKLRCCRSECEEYDPEKDEHATIIETDYFKIQLYEVTGDARVYDLTELGKQQEILVVPEYVGGFPVTLIGFIDPKGYGIRSDNLKKVYIPHTIYSHLYMGLPLGPESIKCKDEVVFLTAEKINLGGLERNGTRIIMMPDAFARSTQGLLEEFVESLVYSSPNIIYHYNYDPEPPNQDIYWLDLILEDSLFLEPDAPKRWGYIFTDWYIDQECTEKWDGVKPTESDKIIELYAGWEQEPI